MRRFTAILISALFLSVISLPTADAASVKSKTAATKAVSNLQIYVNQSSTALTTLKAQALQDEKLLRTASKSTLELLKTKYENAVTAVDTKISNSLIRINSLSLFVVKVSNLSRCNGLCTIGTILNIPFDIKDESAQRSIDQNVASGAIAPQDKQAYDNSRKEYLGLLDEKLMILSRYQQDVTDENSKLLSYLSALNYRLSSDLEAAEINIQTAKSSLKAAKRALSNGGNFEAAFKVAIAFEYNLKMIEMVANSPFSSINSVLSARAVISAADDFDRGTNIDLRYTYSKADAFNKSYRNVFTSDQEFISLLAKAMNLYRKASN